MDWITLLLVLYSLRTRILVSSYNLWLSVFLVWIFFCYISNFFSNRCPIAVSRPQVSAPPGFSAPNRLPPPGFSSHERVGLSSDTVPGISFFYYGVAKSVVDAIDYNYCALVS